MNQKITFPELVTAVATATNTTKRISEDFLKEFFNLVATQLVDGENVKIKHIGTFKLVDVDTRKSVNVSTGEEYNIPGHRKISFTPDKELAEAVNLPFSAFETVELADDVSDEMLNSVNTDTISEKQSVETNIEPLEYTQKDIDNTSDTEKPIVDDLPKIEWTDDETSESEPTFQPPTAESNIAEQPRMPDNDTLPQSNIKSDYKISMSDSDEQESAVNNKNFVNGYIWGGVTAAIVLTIGIVGWRIASPESFTSILGINTAPIQSIEAEVVADSIIKSSETNTQAVDSLKIDSIHNSSKQQIANESVNTLPSDNKIVYDTITQTRYLTTMAKQHYGNYNLWPYIYEENKAILGHPDRIRPGTRIVIPPASKYNIDAKNKECVAKAKKMGIEIYSHYKK